MKFLVIEEEQLIELFDRLVQHMEEKFLKEKKEWLSPEEAMDALGISSTTTLQRYRDEGKIRYTQPSKKVIRYDAQSIDDFLTSKAKNTF